MERTLQILIETCLDIANHIIADGGMRIPTGYSDTFAILRENTVISSSLFKTMDSMAKFRNVIVHQYEKIDPELVVLIHHKKLRDFEKYKDAILQYMSEKQT